MTDALKVGMLVQNFPSHERCARDYASLLAELCTWVASPADADMVVLHGEPRYYGKALHDLPYLRSKYLIGYAVWEADPLPPTWAQALQLVDEVWTASAYCHRLLSAQHANVVWVPHVVARALESSDDERAQVDSWLGKDDAFNFLALTQAAQPRKGAAVLYRAFANVAQRLPKARLIDKTVDLRRAPGATPSVTRRGQVLTLEGMLTPGALNALFRRSHAYVSPHHAEGWGLNLSDAMLLGVPVIATDYSGNMDFMTPYNSLPVRCTEAPIGADATDAFTPHMRWGQVHQESLEAQMVRCHDLWQSGELEALVAQARRDIACFDRAHVGALLHQHLTTLAARWRRGQARPARQRTIPWGQVGPQTSLIWKVPA